MKKVSRRKVIQSGVAVAGLLATSGCSTLLNTKNDRQPSTDMTELNQYDFIIVGAGAGGGSLAIRLAQAGFYILLLEAGGDKNSGYSEVPVLHGKASDDPLINWGFFVQRYAENMKQYDLANSKYIPRLSNGYGGGVYYPRGTGLGGSTQMNALIHLYPDPSDWDDIVKATGDSSWSSSAMYAHFQNLHQFYSSNILSEGKDAVFKSIFSESIFSFFADKYKKPWLHLEQAPISLLKDNTLRKFVFAALEKEGLLDEALTIGLQGANLELNPNNPLYINNKRDGLYSIPFNVKNGKRYGIREVLLEMESSGQYKNLKIQRNAFCKKLIFSEQQANKVIGVEYCIGEKIYTASSAGAGVSEIPKSQIRNDNLIAKARNEVIISGGAFNSPQILMLSGIGDSEHLTEMKIPTRIHLPGVGRNLQDRYEITVVSELNAPIEAIKSCRWMEPGDPSYAEWKANPEGHVYSTNGAVISNLIRSNTNKKNPDLNVFGLPGYFKGYLPNWSQKAYGSPNTFSWAILKGHTNNISGWVKLKSNDFKDTPEINFNYFNSETDPIEDDLQSVVQGFRRARSINEKLKNQIIKKEIYPGSQVESEEQIKEFIKKESWGHHASCSNKMGSHNDYTAVVDSEFKVIKTEGLRIVDASVYPKIPGLFIALPTMIIAEKAAQMLIEKYKK